MARRAHRSGLLLSALFFARSAAAGGPITGEGTPIKTSNYGLDLFQGPVLATTRITALGGAYTAIAEDTDGITFNPAAASFRQPYSTTRDDYDLTGGITLPASVSGTDFDNDGKVGFKHDSFVWLTGGGIIQHDHLGFGLIASYQNYVLPTQPIPLPNSTEVVSELDVRIVRVDPVVSYGFLDGQLHIGAGLRFAGFYGIGESKAPNSSSVEERELLTSNTIGAQVGGLWAPKDLPFRVGGAARSPSTELEGDTGRIPKNADGDRVAGTLFFPTRLELPWEAEAGFAIQLWKRPFNLPWYDEDKVPEADTERWRRTVNGQTESHSRGARRLLKARYRDLPRQRVLLSVSSLVSGPVKDAVSVESMLAQTVSRSGEHASITLRGGAEAEVIPTWLVLRAGTYLEPSRFEQGSSRLHGTFGFAARVLEWSVFGLYDEGTRFRISGAVDLARDYFGWSVGAGLFR